MITQNIHYIALYKCSQGITVRIKFNLMKQDFNEFRKFKESEKSVKHLLAPFKYHVCHPCLANTVVASCSLKTKGGR